MKITPRGLEHSPKKCNFDLFFFSKNYPSELVSTLTIALLQKGRFPDNLLTFIIRGCSSSFKKSFSVNFWTFLHFCERFLGSFVRIVHLF